jgi:hypothetical protein
MKPIAVFVSFGVSKKTSERATEIGATPTRAHFTSIVTDGRRKIPPEAPWAIG